MNRRAFLLSLPFIPAAVKAVTSAERAPVPAAPVGRWLQTRRTVFYPFPQPDYDVLTDRKTAEKIHEAYAKYYAKRYGVAV